MPGRRAARLLVLGAAVMLAACAGAGSSGSPDRPAPAPSVPGWVLEQRVPLPAGGQATAVMGTGRYRTFGWRPTGGRADHQVGVVDLRTGRSTLLDALDPRASTTGNWSDGRLMVRSEVVQADVPEAPVTWRLWQETLPPATPVPLDASDGAVPLEGQPTVAITDRAVVWTKGVAACRCWRVMASRPGAAPELLLQAPVGVVVKGDGHRVLVLAERAHVVDPASGRDVVLPVDRVATGALAGRRVVLFQPPTDRLGAGHGRLVLLDVPAGGVPRVVDTVEAPVGVGQVDFLDPGHVFLLLADDAQPTRLLDLRTRALEAAPPVVDVSARYALDGGTMTTVAGTPGHEELQVWHHMGA
ncbi:MAG TPA: hypothetical protein VFS29_02420 [Motilibacteraceae bacterium]|nr:hypothetical protein [Motilibacteraceae bacterium]